VTVVLVFALELPTLPIPVVLQSPVALTEVPEYATAATPPALEYVPDPVSEPLDALRQLTRNAAVVPPLLVETVVTEVLLASLPGAVVEPLRKANVTTRSPVLTALSVQDVVADEQEPDRVIAPKHGEAISRAAARRLGNLNCRFALAQGGLALNTCPILRLLFVLSRIADLAQSVAAMFAVD